MAEHAGRDWVFSLFDIVILGRDARAAVRRGDGMFWRKPDVRRRLLWTSLASATLVGMRKPMRVLGESGGLGGVDPYRRTAIA